MSAPWAAAALDVYEGALREAGRGGPARFDAVGEDGSRRRFPVERWLRRPDEHERDLLDRAEGPVLDVGCGAGRHVAALRRRGVEAVGIELSPHAAALARERGALVIEGSVFDHPLPAIFSTALLLDGNIGIGGDPAGLLRRVGSLLRGAGAVLVELEPPLTSCRSSRVRLEGGRRRSGWVDWSFVAADDIERLAAAAGFSVAERWSADGRWFARLRREGLGMAELGTRSPVASAREAWGPASTGATRESRRPPEGGTGSGPAPDDRRGSWPRRRPSAELWVPALIVGGALMTLAVGLVAKGLGAKWGAVEQPLLLFPLPAISPWALPAIAVLAAAVLGAPRLLDARIRPVVLAPGLFVLTLLTRLALNVIRAGPGALQNAFEVHHHGEGRTEYLPALPFLHGGVGPFLDHFDSLVPSLPDQAAGHPPGFVLSLHALGIDGPGGVAALAILGGALATPALYLLGRELFDERGARVAALLFVFVPTSLLYGATSADALFATLGVVAAAGLLARRPAGRASGALGLAVASFFSWALLGAGAWAVLVRWRRSGVASAARLAVLAGVVVVVGYLVLYAATGFDPIAVLRATDSNYHAGIARLRPYLFWLFGSPAAFVLMLGPVAWFAGRSLGAKEDTAVALGIVIAVAAVAGYTKAETERIWLFLVPFACLAAAKALPRRWLGPMLVALCTQAVLVQIVFFTKW